MTNMIVYAADDVTSEHELTTMLRHAHRITFMDETFIVFRINYNGRQIAHVERTDGGVVIPGECVYDSYEQVAKALLKYFGDKKQEQMVKFQSTDSMDDIYQKVLALAGAKNKTMIEIDGVEYTFYCYTGGASTIIPGQVFVHSSQLGYLRMGWNNDDMALMDLRQMTVTIWRTIHPGTRMDKIVFKRAGSVADHLAVLNYVAEVAATGKTVIPVFFEDVHMTIVCEADSFTMDVYNCHAGYVTQFDEAQCVIKSRGTLLDLAVDIRDYMQANFELPPVEIHPEDSNDEILEAHHELIERHLAKFPGAFSFENVIPVRVGNAMMSVAFNDIGFLYLGNFTNEECIAVYGNQARSTADGLTWLNNNRAILSGGEFVEVVRKFFFDEREIIEKPIVEFNGAETEMEICHKIDGLIDAYEEQFPGPFSIKNVIPIRIAGTDMVFMHENCMPRSVTICVASVDQFHSMQLDKSVFVAIHWFNGGTWMFETTEVVTAIRGFCQTRPEWAGMKYVTCPSCGGKMEKIDSDWSVVGEVNLRSLKIGEAFHGVDEYHCIHEFCGQTIFVPVK